MLDMSILLKSLQKDKNFAMSNLTEFTDTKSKMAQMGKYFLDRIETLWEMRKCLLKALSSFPTMFSKETFARVNPLLHIY